MTPDHPRTLAVADPEIGKVLDRGNGELLSAGEAIGDDYEIAGQLKKTLTRTRHSFGPTVPVSRLTAILAEEATVDNPIMTGRSSATTATHPDLIPGVRQRLLP